MEIQRLNKEDIVMLKLAMSTHKKTIAIAIVVNTFVFILLFIELKFNASGLYNNNTPHWALIFIPFTFFVSMIYTFVRYWYYISDIRKCEKLIFKGKCKLEVIEFDSGTRYELMMKGFKTVEFSEFNRIKYGNYFLEDDFLEHEIHLAPKSETILYAKRV